MTYDIDYFINKFESIPEENWIDGALEGIDNKKCAFGHCGVISTDSLYKHTEESTALISLFGGEPGNNRCVYSINDGHNLTSAERFATTPKQRILNKLKSLKE